MTAKKFDDDHVREYEFSTIDDSKGYANTNVVEYNIDDTNFFSNLPKDEHKRKIQRELTLAKEKDFHICPVVKLYRGIGLQEKENQRKEIEKNVEAKFSTLKDKAFKVGREEGVEVGKQEAYEIMKRSASDKLEEITKIVTDVMQEKERLLQKEKIEVYQIIKNLTKWIILRELKDDNDYIKRLLDKLIGEIGQDNNFIVKVGRNKFGQDADIQKMIERKIRKKTNVSVEFDSTIDQGIIIESTHSIVNGTLEEQFKSFDKIFETVGGSHQTKKSAS